MAYSTLAKVQTAAGGTRRLAQLSDLEGGGLEINLDVVNEAIAAADAWINSYVHKRHDVELPEPVPPVVEQISADEAVFILKQRRQAITETDLRLHEERERRLADFAMGKTTLGIEPLPAKSSLVVNRVGSRPEGKSFARSKWEGFK